MNEVIIPKWIEKYLNTPKKCSRQLRDRFIKELEILYENAEAGETLVGDLADHYKIDFAHKDVEYRIVYSILSVNELFVVYCGTRENAYVKIKRSL